MLVLKFNPTFFGFDGAGSIATGNFFLIGKALSLKIILQYPVLVFTDRKVVKYQ